ncbi:MAG: substrate-binding domain-containing protein, partial [Nitrospira sp.]|nr:substrate-binding domain-containing protein [Nitrospira sp.]
METNLSILFISIIGLALSSVEWKPYPETRSSFQRVASLTQTSQPVSAKEELRPGLLMASTIGPTQKNIILATTTSTQDSGLLDALIPIFEKNTGYTVKTISVGSGQAMALGERGEADVLLVHAPDAEKKFVENGWGVNRRLIMYNDFVLVGPPHDPAQLKGVLSSAEGLKKIATTEALFISRGDKSGTHQLEKKLWKNSGMSPE